MAYICIQIRPERMANVDLDILYDLPNLLVNLSGDDLIVEDNGYTYSDDEQYLNIFMLVSDISVFWKKTKYLLENTKVLGNFVLESAIITYHYDDAKYLLLSHFDKSEAIDKIT